MLIGELDRRVTIEQPVVELNDYGETQIDSWITTREVWSKVEWKNGTEGEDADKITATTFVTFYIRNLDLDNFLNGNTAATMEHRIAFAPQSVTKYYYFETLEQIEGRESFLKITTKEKN
jgi:head-tail adaptor